MTDNGSTPSNSLEQVLAASSGMLRGAVAANRPLALVAAQKVRSERVRRSGARRPTKPLVLIVEDDPATQSTLYERKLRASTKVGFGLASCLEVARSFVCCGEQQFTVVVVDLNLGDGDGAEFVHEVLLADPEVEVVVASGFEEDRVRERLGSFDEKRVRIWRKDDPFLADRIVELALETRKAQRGIALVAK